MHDGNYRPAAIDKYARCNWEDMDGNVQGKLSNRSKQGSMGHRPMPQKGLPNRKGAEHTILAVIQSDVE